MDERMPTSTAAEHLTPSTELSVESITFANLVQHAAELPPEERERFFKDLQHRRRLNDYNRTNGEPTLIDDAIVELIGGW